MAPGPVKRRCLDNVSLDRDLLLEFFLTFARFEFALKATGFITSRRPILGRAVEGLTPTAEPDWRRFANGIDLAIACTDRACSTAVEFLRLNPPWREVFLGEKLRIAWDASTGFLEIGSMVQVLELVRSVRNNLFHGGKFSEHAAFSEPERNELLLRHSLAVLHRCLELSPSVADSYDAAIL